MKLPAADLFAGARGRSRRCALVLAVACVLVASPLLRAETAAARTITDDTTRSSATTPCDTTGQPTTTVYLPNVTKTLGGPAGWDTPFYVQNAGAIQTTLEISFYLFSNGALVACRKTAGVPPGATLADDPNADADLPDNAQFSVVVRSFGAPVVAVVNQVQGTGASTQALSYAGFTGGATKVFLPNVTRRFYGYDVPFIVQNLGPATASVTAAFVSFDATLHFSTSLVIAPGRSGVVDPDFTAGLIDGTQYAVTLTSNQPIGVVVNAHNETGSPVAYSHNGLAVGATTLYAPYAVKGGAGGRVSPVVVQNLGAAAVDAALTFTPLGGGAAQTLTLTAIPPGGSKAFDPRFALGTTTPCASASATCLGAGEFALVINATGPVAAVVLPVSDGTAAGYLASSQPSARQVLPVVFRSVGGASGWTGVAYLQAVSAGQLTVRFYAIGSGQLAATQSVALVRGSSVRLDPRTVAGLVDGTAYAVTADGNGGTFAAIVWEQASTGGDASMIYEAFPAAALPTTPQLGSIVVTPATAPVEPGATQQFATSARDQFGAPLAGQTFAWAVTPATLGTVSTGGVFTASASGSGSGTVTATAGTVSSSAVVTVRLPATQTVGGIAFQISSQGTTDVYAEATISASDQATIAATADTDVARVQTDFGRAYTRRPKIYVFATTASYTQGLQSILEVPGPEAQTAGATTDGLFSSNPVAIAANWSKITQSKPISAIRHELTHMMERQIVTAVSLPQWFNEGTARLEDLTVPGSDYRANQVRYGAASMAATGGLFSIGDLTSNAQWNARTGTPATYQYYQAAQMVQLIRDDIGQANHLRIFDLMEQRQTFDQAYLAVSGQSLATFSGSVAARIKALAPAYPGIATATDSAAGPGLAIQLYGFTPGSSVTMSISGPSRSSSTTTNTADEYGVYRTYLTSSWPAGAYSITATGPNGTATASAVKSPSVTATSTTVWSPIELLLPDALEPVSVW